MKCELLYEDFTIKFDDKQMPVLDNAASVADYEILKKILLDPQIMKTSSLACGEVPDDDLFHRSIYLFLSPKVNIKKIFIKRNMTLIGIGGIIYRNNEDGVPIFELAMFLLKEFHSNVYGYFATIDVCNFAPQESILIASSINHRYIKIMNKIGFKMLFSENNGDTDLSTKVHFLLKTSKLSQILEEKLKPFFILSAV